MYLWCVLRPKQVGLTFKDYYYLLVLYLVFQMINVRTSREEFCGDGKRIEPRDMDFLDWQIEQAKSADDWILKEILELRPVETSPVLKQSALISCRQKSLLVNARNDFVMECLQRNYSEKVSGGKLKVFCVSSTNYEKFSEIGNVDMINASGIPALRRFCSTIVATSRSFEAKNFLQSSLPSLLTSVRLWVEKDQCTGTPRRNARLEFFKSFRIMCNKIKDTITKIIDGFRQSFQRQLLDRADKRFDSWAIAAK